MMHINKASSILSAGVSGLKPCLGTISSKNIFHSPRTLTHTFFTLTPKFLCRLLSSFCPDDFHLEFQDIL